MLRKVLFLAIATLCIGTSVFAYTPNNKDKVIIMKLTNAIEKVIEQQGEGKRSSLVVALKKIQNKDQYKSNERMQFVLKNVIGRIESKGGNSSSISEKKGESNVEKYFENYKDPIDIMFKNALLKEKLDFIMIPNHIQSQVNGPYGVIDVDGGYRFSLYENKEEICKVLEVFKDKNFSCEEGNGLYIEFKMIDEENVKFFMSYGDGMIENRLINKRYNKDKLMKNDFSPENNENSWAEYSDNEIGISFSYPESWGEITKNSEEGTEGVSLVTLTIEGDGILFSLSNGKTPVGRGAFWGDTANRINSQSFVNDFCNSKETSCEIKETKNGITYAEEVRRGESYYYLYNPNSSFRGIVISTERMNDDAMEKVQEVVESINYLR